MNRRPRNLLVILDYEGSPPQIIEKAFEAADKFKNKKVEPWVVGKVTPSEVYVASNKPYTNPADYADRVRIQSPDTTKMLTDYYQIPPLFKDGHYYLRSSVNPDVKLTDYRIAGDSKFLLPTIHSKTPMNFLKKKSLDLWHFHCQAKEKALKTYEEFEKLLDNNLWMDEPGPVYADLFNKHHHDLTLALHEYRSDEWRNTVRSAFNIEDHDPVEYFCYGTGDKEAFVTRAVRGSFFSDAVIDTDGEWWERFEMTQSGSVHNPLPHDEWLDNFYRLLEGTDDESYIVSMDIYPISLQEAMEQEIFSGRI